MRAGLLPSRLAWRRPWPDRARSAAAWRARRGPQHRPSVPAVPLPERPCTARIAVPALDVPETPLDLGSRVRLPVRPGGGHLRAGPRLRDAVGAAGVLRRHVPAALPAPQIVQAAELRARLPAVRGQHAVRD